MRRLASCHDNSSTPGEPETVAVSEGIQPDGSWYINNTGCLSALDAARQADLGEYAGWLDSERIVGNLHRGYAELDGAERGQPIDLIAAIGDMITYNGGRPLARHA